MKDKSVRVEQIRISRLNDKEAAAAWNRVQKNMKASKPVESNRFRKT